MPTFRSPVAEGALAKSESVRVSQQPEPMGAW